MRKKRKPQRDVTLSREVALQALRGNNPTYAVKVTETINSIKEEWLKRPDVQMAYADQLVLQRNVNQLTLAEVADKIGATHSTVRKLENKDIPKRKINTAYLEAFSLLYQVSPLYLVSLPYLLKKAEKDEIRETPVDPEICPNPITSGSYILDSQITESPFFEYEPHTVQMVQCILKNLYNENRDQYAIEMQLLDDFEKVCGATYDWLIKIKKSFLSAPKFEVLIKSNSALSENAFSDDGWWDFLTAHSSSRNYLYNIQEKLCIIGVRDSELLDIMAYLSCADSDVKKAACIWLEEGGFLNRPQSFRQNDCSKKVSIIEKDQCVSVSVSDNPSLSNNSYDIGIITPLAHSIKKD